LQYFLPVLFGAWYTIVREEIKNSNKYSLSMRFVIFYSKNTIFFSYILFDLSIYFQFGRASMVAHLHSIDKW